MDKQEFVDFIKFGLKINLENELYAEFDDIIDKVHSSCVTPTNKLVLKFANSCEDMFLEARFDPYDYDIRCRKSTIVKPMETAQAHQEKRKEYINFVASHVEQKCGKQAKDDYLKHLSKNITVDEKVM